ncbi:hypothetical protein [Polaribacter glomeratus]|uniref:Beta-carotene 15,15'-monooxygenase n=1 Tax=Polaribacter glomeratus TaxID=102 RepID=A0A2S7WX11_9FLAO|nr:hypothetical protein [Polaribacter glomeratus]PQJ82087.1 hypothetical protein BTO16_05650 [Polaribacter glomeratus]TXD66681.1 hypothetical protein ESX12_03960 [Polaribacter glomeratus]
MDLLDKYKKAWNNQPKETDTFSALEIYKLAHSKSSSVVKWIFIIALLEFVLWSSLNLLMPEDFYKIYRDLNLMHFINIFTIFHYLIIVAFLFLFYKNYKRISLIDNTKRLIKSILGIRKTVKYYVIYNLAMVFLISIIVNITMFSDSDKLLKTMNPNNLTMDISQVLTITIITQIIVLIVVLVFLWLFYKLLYGILLRKLNTNYKELTKLDNLN